MDKITRMLILYSSLINGEEINKTIFCFENDCSPRSFDRDIEDIRLFLSESFSVLELNYNRINNTYCIKGAKKQQLEFMEYLFVEKILQDTSVLRNDELGILKSHLLINTRDAPKMPKSLNQIYTVSESQKHNKALLKMHGDLELTIRNQKYIRLVYQDNINRKHIYDIIPCSLRYKSGHLYFIGYIEKEEKITAIRLDRVYSFEILREQTISERKKVARYMMSYTNNEFLELYDNFVEIILECTETDYAVLCTVFDNIQTVQQIDNLLKISFKTSEEAFNHWYLSHLDSNVTIIQPQHIKERLIMQAKKILRKYGGKD